MNPLMFKCLEVFPATVFSFVQTFSFPTQKLALLVPPIIFYWPIDIVKQTNMKFLIVSVWQFLTSLYVFKFKVKLDI